MISRRLDPQGKWCGLLFTDDEDEDENDDSYTRVSLFFDEIDVDGTHCHPFLVVEIGTKDEGFGPDERGVTLELNDLAELHRELGEYLQGATYQPRPEGCPAVRETGKHMDSIDNPGTCAICGRAIR